MSYRTFKHLIGETSLERKCRFIFGGAILILITGSFFWYGRKTEAMVYDQNLHTCRMLVNPILLRDHWKALEFDSDFRPVIDQMAGDLVQYKSRFIKPLNVDDPDHGSRNDVEDDALV